MVQQRLVTEYGYDEHSAKEALSYVTTLLAQEWRGTRSKEYELTPMDEAASATQHPVPEVYELFARRA